MFGSKKAAAPEGIARLLRTDVAQRRGETNIFSGEVATTGRSVLSGYRRNLPLAMTKTCWHCPIRRTTRLARIHSLAGTRKITMEATAQNNTQNARHSPLTSAKGSPIRSTAHTHTTPRCRTRQLSVRLVITRNPAILSWTACGVRDDRCCSPANCRSPDSELRASIELERRIAGLDAIEWGRRDVIVNDLSPAATFIAANYNCPPDHSAFNETITEILDTLHGELDWIYTTQHTKQVTGRIEFTVWSEVFSCSQCSKEVVFFDVALDHETQRVLGELPCPHCCFSAN